MKKKYLLIGIVILLVTGCSMPSKKNPYQNQVSHEKINKENSMVICTKKEKESDTDYKKKDDSIELNSEGKLVKFGTIQSKNSKQYYEIYCNSYIETKKKVEEEKDPGHIYLYSCDEDNFTTSYGHFYVVDDLLEEKKEENMLTIKKYINEEGIFDKSRWINDHTNREFECREEE